MYLTPRSLHKCSAEAISKLHCVESSRGLCSSQVLLTSHRGSCGILLEARMKVIDEWNGEPTPPR